MSVHHGGRGPGHLSRWPKAAVSYTAEATALFARMSTQPDATRKSLIDYTITSLKTASLWDKFEVLYFLAAHDAQAARLNWKSSSFDCTAVNSPTFTTDLGYAGNGSSSYLNTGWTPASSSVYLQNSASFGIFLNAGTDTANSSAAAMGVVDSSGYGAFVSPRAATDTTRGRINISTSVNYGPTFASRLGMTIVSRIGSASSRAHKNPSNSFVETTASAGRPNANVYIGCYNNNGTPANYADNRAAFAFGGSGLTLIDAINIKTITSYYFTSIAYGRLDRVLADMIALGRDRGTYSAGAYSLYDVTRFNGKFYVCWTAGTSASDPDVNTSMFVELPLATGESAFLDDPFDTDAGTADGRVTPQGYAWRTTGPGSANAVITGGYMTSDGNTYFVQKGLDQQISEITVKCQRPNSAGGGTLSISPDPDFLDVTFKQMWHINWNDSVTGNVTWWNDPDNTGNSSLLAQAWTTGKIAFGKDQTEQVVPVDGLEHTMTVKLRGKFLFGYLDDVLQFIHCDDLIETLCGANACSFFVQNHTGSVVGDERQTRVTVKTATIA